MHYDSHQRPMTTGFGLLPFAPYTQRTREEAVKEKQPSTPRGENQVGIYGPVLVLGW